LSVVKKQQKPLRRKKNANLFGRSFSMRDSPVVSQRGELRGGWFCKIKYLETKQQHL